MKTRILILNVVLAGTMYAAINVPLTIQETLYPGSIAGVTRTVDPLTVGIPLPDSADGGATDVNSLGLSGAAVGQFRVLARWPSGRIKWVLVDTQAGLTAGQSNTSITLTTGSGNFGGANLASDDGTVITVTTGAAVFTIRKANFNGLDVVDIGPSHAVLAGASTGFTMVGPSPTAAYPGNVTCSPDPGGAACTTVYSSSNDSASACLIEENGPARAAVKCSYNLMDNAGHSYMRGTARLFFYRGKTAVKITSVLRNADYGKDNTTATAYKGYRGFELRIAPNLTGSLQYAIGNHTATPTTGSITGTDDVYVYQATSTLMKSANYCGGGSGCVVPSPDTGYKIVKNGSTLASGSASQYAAGWADISDSAGLGMEIGAYQMAAYETKSLEFSGGGSDARIGIMAPQSSRPYYQIWPQWKSYDVYLNFHSAPVTPSAEFLKFQHPLVARASYTHYNATGVFPYQLVDPSTEDTWYKSTAATAVPAISQSISCCISDLGTTDSGTMLGTYPYWGWGNPGAPTQTEYRWSNLLTFLTRGHTGRYLDSAHFYRMQADSAYPLSDGFNWRDKGYFGSASAELDGFGQPQTRSANSTLAGRAWHDQEHNHWYGVTDFYYMSGDETVREATLEGAKDWFLNPNTYQAAQGPKYFTAARGLWNSRANGAFLIGAARFGKFLQETGDPDGEAVLAIGTTNYNSTAKPDMCISGYPAGCSETLAASGGRSQGVNRVRGVRWGTLGELTDTWCGVTKTWRMVAAFQSSIFIQGLLELRDAKGPGWADYWESLDLAYGMSQWLLSEMFADDGSGRWDTNGFHYYMAVDGANSCTNPGETPENYFTVSSSGQQTVSMPFIAANLVEGGTAWSRKFKINWQKLLSTFGTTASDHSSYQPAHLISALSKPNPVTLQAIPIADFKDNGAGSYTISWTVPTGAQSYRIKWGPKRIVEWVGFDPLKQAFVGDPSNTMPWFAASNVSALPAPGTANSLQSLTINTGQTGLTAAHFSVKAFAPPSSLPTAGASTLISVSGSGQTGTAGQPLSNPLVAEALDTNSRPVSGVVVTFAVAGGGGSLSATQLTTDGQGLASTRLTLGSSAGLNTVTASAPGLSGSPLTFTATGTLASRVPTALISVSGNAQSGTVGKALVSPFVVRVNDAAGTAVAGVTVTFSITSGGGSMGLAQVATDTSGLAANTLTLGPNAGTNTVAVASGTLAGSPLVFTATGIAAQPSTGPYITWVKSGVRLNPPRPAQWQTIHYEPVGRTTIIYQSTNASIYSNGIWHFKASDESITYLGSSGSTTGDCPANTATWPGDRHPVGQMAIDTRRNVMWLAGGVCGGYLKTDTYQLKLNANPAANTWRQLNPAHYPGETRFSSMVYDPDSDIVLTYGYDGGSDTHDTFIYCPTDLNLKMGTLTSAQTAAGCVRPDDWNEVNVKLVGTGRPRSNFPSMVYDSKNKTIILVAGSTPVQTWAYDVPTKTFTNLSPAISPPTPSADLHTQVAITYNDATGLVYFHDSSTPSDWTYNYATNLWTSWGNLGGPTNSETIAYDPNVNALVSWNKNPASNSLAEIWIGKLSTTTPLPASCDINADGLVNIIDVQFVIQQALGRAACKTGDLNNDGRCDSADVTIAVGNALVGACRSNP